MADKIFSGMYNKKELQLEVAKLLTIMRQEGEGEMISKTYIMEKLIRILDETGIIIHPALNNYPKVFWRIYTPEGKEEQIIEEL